jgi:hypothetical protein
MSEFITWVQQYHSQLMTGGFFAMQGICLLVLLVASRRIKTVKRKLEDATGQVEHYLQVVMESETGNEEEGTPSRVSSTRAQEEENRLITSVLREIFP